MNITPEQIEEYRVKIKKYSNSGKYKKAYDLSSKLHKKYPEVLLFAYFEAVYTAEEHRGFTPSQLKSRYKLAASKLKKLLLRLRSADPKIKKSIQNEYYWFSRQPHKQYLLGVANVKKGDLFSYYSQGVGAVEVAHLMALKGKHTLSLKWAKKSEKAWLKYFEVMPDWFNSYLFYGKALGIQGKIKEMNDAFKVASKISGIPLKNEMFKPFTEDVNVILKLKK